MRWSVSIQAEGDRPVELDEVVALADAVAPLSGIASGVGAMAYGAQIVVEAPTADEAVELAIPAFGAAVAAAELPAWPVVRAEVIGEDDNLLENAGIGEDDDPLEDTGVGQGDDLGDTVDGLGP